MSTLTLLDVFIFISTFGWFLLIPIMERIWCIYKQPFWRWSLISDTIYTYQGFALQFLFAASSPIFVEVLLNTSVQLHFFPSDGMGYLQNSLATQPIWVNFIALIFFGEVAFYTAHYFSHKIPFLWEFHRVHHSSVIVDAFSTSRFHMFDRVLFTLPNLMCMAYFGATGEAVMYYFFMRNFMDRYIHSNIDAPRWTHKLMLSSPHFHRWHHSTDPAAQDTNFSGDFIFLDVLFGTAYDPSPKEKAPPREFGEVGYSNNLIVHQFLPFYHLYLKFKEKQSIKALFRLSPSNS